MNCEIEVMNGEKVGIHPFEGVPRAGEMIVMADGHSFEVHHVEHHINKFGQTRVLLVVYKRSGSLAE